MSSRRKTTRRDYEDADEVTPEEGEVIVQAVSSRGGNLFQVVCSDGKTPGLALLPTKFRKLIWIKRGMFLFCSRSDGDVDTVKGERGKVNYLITRVLMPNQEKYLRTTEYWPAAFRAEVDGVDAAVDGDEAAEDSDDSMAGVFKNTNRRGFTDSEESSDDSDEE
jgi:probable RNA-binding protein EIF1AD